ncbi:MAG: sulfotransferase [Phycisphaerales bacterium]|nr:sulfotransferase [Phycisphaerales bacterium]
MTLPNFIIGGAAKCASTSLHAYLDEHPEVAMSRPKQTHFWDTDTLYSRGLEHYATYFAHVTDEKAVGETTPSYMHGRYIAERIKAGIPDIRMIFIFRDPVKRAYSNYWHGYRKGRVVGSFADTLDNPDCRHFWERGRYAKFLEDCFDVFGRERCHLLLTEQLNKQPHETLEKIWRFLEVDPAFRCAIAGERRNTHRIPRSMALQRFAYLHLSAAGKPEDNSQYDEDGNLEIHFKYRRFWRARKFATGVINRFNMKDADYPPLDEDTAQRARMKFVDDNRRFADLTGIDIHQWWTYA